MERYCKNCGAKIDGGTFKCPDCGKDINDPKLRNVFDYCPICGVKIDNNDNKCQNCGTVFSSPKSALPKESRFEKYKKPAIIIAIILVIAVFALLTLPEEIDYEEDAVDGEQVIEIDPLEFELPAGYELNDTNVEVDYDSEGSAVSGVSQIWTKGNDTVNITSINIENYNADELMKDIGGEEKTYFGQTGYYEKVDGVETFVFTDENYLYEIDALDKGVFDQIKIVN